MDAPEEAAGNAGMCAGRVLAWLQDTKAANAWGLWHADFRDVIVIDDQNKVVEIYNLTLHDLRTPANYDSLRTVLITAAGHTLGTARLTR